MYKCIASCSKITLQISAQCIQPFPRHRKGVRTCISADTDTPSITCVTPITNGPLHLHTEVPGHASRRSSYTEKGVPNIQKRDTHVRTCRCTPLLACPKRIANGSLTTHQILAQSVQPFQRQRKGQRTRLRADVSIIGLCKTLRYLVFNHTPHFSAIRPAFLVLRDSGVHLHLRTCRCTPIPPINCGICVATGL